MLTKEEYAANRKKWVEALRSGEYEQGTGQLRNDDCYCCLGVAHDLFGNSSDLAMPGDSSLKRSSARDALGLSASDGFIGGDLTGLIQLNDIAKKTFNEIADIIESNPDGLWAEGTY